MKSPTKPAKRTTRKAAKPQFRNSVPRAGDEQREVLRGLKERASPRRGRRVQLGVDERRERTAAPGPEHPDARDVGRAGDEFIPAPDAELGDEDLEGDEDAGADRLTGDGVAVILKGVMKAVALLTRDDYYALDDVEISEITEPMARQINRIPVVSSVLDQNTADLFAIGAGVGAILMDRLNHAADVAKAKREAKFGPYRGKADPAKKPDEPVDTTATVQPRDQDPAAAAANGRPAETPTTASRFGDGTMYQEVRESRGPANLGPFMTRPE